MSIESTVIYSTLLDKSSAETDSRYSGIGDITDQKPQA